MPKILLKEIFVEIKHSLGRFISITAIVALGVAFFAGIKASAPDMKYSADQYFDKYNLQDIQVFSTIGLDDKDLKALSEVEGVEAVQPVYSIDTIVKNGNTASVFRLFSLPEEQKVNNLRIVEGRLPQSDDECLIEADSVHNTLFSSFEIGETISLQSGNDTDLKDELTRTKFKVVGKGYTPNYLSYTIGTSNIGSGTVDNFIYVKDSVIKKDYFTEIDILVSGASQINTYTDSYFDVVDPVTERIEDLADKQIETNLDTKRKQIEDAKKELDDKITQAKKKIESGKKNLEQGKKELQEKEAEAAESKKTLDSGFAQYESGLSQINSGINQIDNGIAEIQKQQNNLPVLKNQLEQINQGLSQLNPNIETIHVAVNKIDQTLAQRAQIESQISQIKTQLSLPELGEEQKEQLNAQLALLEQGLSSIPSSQELQTQKEQLNTQLSELIVKQEELNNNKNQLESSIAQIQNAASTIAALQDKRKELENTKIQLESTHQQLIQGQKDLEDGLAQIETAKKQIADSEKELAENEEKIEKEQQKGLKEIEKNEKNLNSLDAKWIVLDRNSHYSYRDYEACADRMDGIASVFPVFFFLVAALVCMTTMTRMVDEQRTEIGTLKALGYTKFQIAFKYLAYAFLAAVLGSVIGCTIGMFVFPYIIFYAWNTMYTIETIQFEWQPDIILMASGSVTFVVLLATYYSIQKELREVPSQLMRPKASKAGKQILLEKIPWIWEKIPFLNKVTLRNIFRYKRRFFMTVIGIAGCSALLVAGFGINDSISDIVNLQYDKIYHYDADVSVEKQNIDSILKELKNIKGIEGIYATDVVNGTLDIDGKDINASIHALDNAKTFEKFVSLYSIEDQQVHSVKDGEAAVNQKMAQKMNLNVGDSFKIEINDKQYSLKVGFIYENYVGHHIYITENTLASLNIPANDISEIIHIQTTDTSEEFEADLGNEIMNIKGVESVTFYSSLQENFLNMIGSIKLVVVVLVLSAASLAFVVLYNLSNVNISERMREIATIKVLGFTEKETNQYVNKESLVLAAIGGAVGLAAGIYLHHLIMSLAELDDVMFGRTITPLSFVVSFILTMVFAVIINYIMKFKLRKIQMVESLKAVE